MDAAATATVAGIATALQQEVSDPNHLQAHLPLLGKMSPMSNTSEPHSHSIHNVVSVAQNITLDVQYADKFDSRLGTYEDYAVGSLLVLIGILSVIGNGSSVVMFWRKYRHLTPAELLLLNISIIHLFLAACSYPAAMVSSFRHRWAFDDIGCKIYGFVCYLIGIATILSMLALAIVRYLKTCTHTYSRTLTADHAKLMLVAIYVYALFWAILPMFPFISQYEVEPFGTSCTLNWANPSTSSRVYIVCSITFIVVIPYVVMFWCYSRIILLVRRNHLKKTTMSKKSTNSQTPSQLQLTIVSALVCSGFLVAWCPYAIVSVAYGLRGLQPPVYVSLIPVLLAKSSCAYNPIIYIFITARYRREMKSIIQEKMSWMTCFLKPPVQNNESVSDVNQSSLIRIPLEEQSDCRPIIQSKDQQNARSNQPAARQKDPCVETSSSGCKESSCSDFPATAEEAEGVGLISNNRCVESIQLQVIERSEETLKSEEKSEQHATEKSEIKEKTEQYDEVKCTSREETTPQRSVLLEQKDYEVLEISTPPIVGGEGDKEAPDTCVHSIHVHTEPNGREVSAAQVQDAVFPLYGLPNQAPFTRGKSQIIIQLGREEEASRNIEKAGSSSQSSNGTQNARQGNSDHVAPRKVPVRACKSLPQPLGNPPLIMTNDSPQNPVMVATKPSKENNKTAISSQSSGSFCLKDMQNTVASEAGSHNVDGCIEQESNAKSDSTEMNITEHLEKKENTVYILDRYGGQDGNRENREVSVELEGIDCHESATSVNLPADRGHLSYGERAVSIHIAPVTEKDVGNHTPTLLDPLIDSCTTVSVCPPDSRANETAGGSTIM